MTDLTAMNEKQAREVATQDCPRCAGDGITPACYAGECSEHCPGMVLCPCVHGEKQEV